MELLLREVLEYSILFDQLTHASEKRVQEIRIAVTGILEQFQYLINEFLAVFCEAWQSHMDYTGHNMEGSHYYRVIVHFKRFQQQRDEWVQLVFNLIREECLFLDGHSLN